MEDKKVQRIILKEKDVLLVKLPETYFRNRIEIRKFYENLRKKLLPRKNKILILPNNIDISVIGQEEVKEYISNMDIWSLWDDNEES